MVKMTFCDALYMGLAKGIWLINNQSFDNRIFHHSRIKYTAILTIRKQLAHNMILLY